jgi:hypothetical protein
MLTQKEKLIKEFGSETRLKKVIGVPLIQKSMRKDDSGMLFITGLFTSDNKDEVGDIITRVATERAIGKYRQWGNIRRMHLPDPVGKVIRIGEEDGMSWNEVEIKVINPKAVFEVENGLLQALSVGIFFTWDDFEVDEDGGWIINNYTLAEISLVDHPANYDAKLDLVNAPKEFRQYARQYGIVPAVRNFSLDIKKSPPCRQEGESFDDCVDRKTEELIEDEGYDPDQAYAAANEMCSESCSESEEDSMEIEDTKDIVEEIEEVIVEDEVEIEEPESEEVESDIEVEEERDIDLTIETETEVEEEVETETEEEVEVEEDIETEEDVSAEEMITYSEFSEFATNVLDRLNELAEVVKTLAEAHEEQVKGEATEEEIEDEFDAHVAFNELSDAVTELSIQIEELKRPSNRQNDVMPFDLEEEDEGKDLESEDEGDNKIRKAVKGYLIKGQKYPVNLN